MKHGIELYTGRYIQAPLRGRYIEIENLQFCTVTETSLLSQKTPIVNFYMEDIIWGRLTVSVGFFYYKLNLMDGFNIISDHIVRGHHFLSGMSNKKNNSRFLSFFTRSTLWSLSHMNKVTSGQEKEHIWFQWEYRLFVWTIIFVYRMMFPFLNTICVSMYVIEFKGPKVKSMTFL